MPAAARVSRTTHAAPSSGTVTSTARGMHTSLTRPARSAGPGRSEVEAHADRRVQVEPGARKDHQAGRDLEEYLQEVRALKGQVQPQGHACDQADGAALE